ncbi:MAG: purine-nucleoside phosphorylase, partial [Agathobaculum sp.]
MTGKQVKESAAYVKNKLPAAPEVGLVLGSGLGQLADQLEDVVYIPYGEIPYFRTSTAPDHIGRFVFGRLAGRKVLCMQGRLHGYEGYAPDEIAYPIYV